ncbi:hypothetical protein [Sphingobacterium faecium]|uniref:hypothetical protein n=1 Tax=Sphingobacterium faecium TaxID=34087 RepID=UPI00320B9E2E
MFDIDINCKTCVPKFSDKYWWSTSQHQKYYGRFLFVSLLISIIRALFLVQDRNERYLFEIIIESYYLINFFALTGSLFFMQCVCFICIRILFHMQINGLAQFKSFCIKMIIVIAVFHLLLPKAIKQYMIFFTTYIQQENVRLTGYLDHEYHRMCKWLLLYSGIWLIYFFWRDNEKKKRQVERTLFENKIMNDGLLRHELRQYLAHAFIVIVKKDIVIRLSTLGYLDIMPRINAELSRALQLDYDQISKSVYIAKAEILDVSDGRVEITAKLREVLDESIKKYKKLGIIVSAIKSEHGVLSVSPVYADKLTN